MVIKGLNGSNLAARDNQPGEEPHPASLFRSHRCLSGYRHVESELSRLAAFARGLGWMSVQFLGFKSQPEIPKDYDLCGVFVHPSEHGPWGLVVNEVMNTGKPVIVSDRWEQAQTW